MLSGWFYPLVLFGVLLATYGYYLPRLGFYWDDWPVVYLSRFEDVSVYWDLFYYIRPLSAWTYVISVPVLGMSPLVWQVFALVQRWVGVLALCAALQGVWPHKTWQVRWMGLLLALFPGFLQQTVSVAYTQHFLTFALFTGSLAGMVWAFRRPERFWLYTIPSLAAALVQMLTMEYFVGLELLRPVLLWFLLRQPEQGRGLTLRRVARAWLPYAAVLGAFVLFRLVFYARLISVPDANPAVLLERAATDPGGALAALLEHAVQDFTHLMINAWTDAIAPETLLFATRQVWLTLAVGLVIAAAAGWMLLRGSMFPPAVAVYTPTRRDPAVWQIPLLGGLAVLLGGLPVWITDRQVIVGTWSDRFALAPMVGAVILIVWLVDWISNRRARQTAALVALLALAIATQLRTTSRYAAYWNIMRQYYWQLSWRAPALEKGTAVIGPEMPFALVGDYSIGFALNALYGGKLDSDRPEYWFIEGDRYLGSKTIPDYHADNPIYYELWNVKFEGNTNQNVPVTFNNARGCLRVIDPIYHGVLPMSPGDEDLMVLTHSNPAILTDAVNPVPEEIFGKEPAREWCYYYQKADLARDLQDWARISALGEEAAAQGYQAENGAELLPFIQAYAMQGQWEQALEKTRQANGLTENMREPLCALWKRVAADAPQSAGKDAALQAARQEWRCGGLVGP